MKRKPIGRRMLSAFLSGCLLLGAAPLAGLSVAAQENDIVLELEDIHVSGGQVRASGEGFSGGFVFVNVVEGSGVGQTLQFDIPFPAAGTYDLSITDKDNVDRGIYAVSVDGNPLTTIDFYNAQAGFCTHSLGRIMVAQPRATLTLTCVGANAHSTGKYGLAADYLTLSPVKAEGDDVVVATSDKAYTELTGTWSTGGVSTTRLSTEKDASAMWASYPPETALLSPHYDIYAYIPAEGTGVADYTIHTLKGRWSVTLDQATVTDGWYKLATVSAVTDTSISVTITNPAEGVIAADSIKILPTTGAVDPIAANSTGSSTGDVCVRVNQIGYEPDKSKRATVVPVEDGTPFAIKAADSGQVLYTGAVKGGVADFTDYRPTATTVCYLECAGVRSYTFTIAKYLMQQASIENALDFMEQARADTFEMGQKGIGWRDSHQFSFEMSSLVLQYMANPAIYDQMPYDVYKADECEYQELRVQDEPNIVWLMEFAALRYYDLAQNDGKKLHMLIKEQLAWFLYAYPFISPYVPEDMYTKIRDLTIRIWGESGCNLSYHSVDGINYYNLYDDTNNKEDNNLFAVQTVIGGIKGQLPPAHSIAPNLMMYEVLTRDGLAGADAYFQAAYDNCAWIIDNIDISAPEYAKGQRMSEHIVMENLSYFLEKYPDRAPAGLKAAIQNWAETMVARAENLWDMRMASSVAAGDAFDSWTGAAYADISGQYENCAMNEPGSIAGLQAAMEAAARVLDDKDLIARLRAIGIAAIDDMFGRNPNGRSYFYNDDYLNEFDGADLGWFQKYNGGNGVLRNVVGRIDGSPKEAAYEGDHHCNPGAAAGYTEAWVAYNTAWNSSLAYSAASDVALSVEKSEAVVGEPVTITLRAPLNMDAAAIETATVRVLNRTTGEERVLTLAENSADDYAFSGTLTPQQPGDVLDIAYGYGLFEQVVSVTVKEAAPSSVVYGDVNQSGDVDLVDALITLQAAAGIVELTEPQKKAADVDGTAGVSANDALLILQHATKRLQTFPVESK